MVPEWIQFAPYSQIGPAVSSLWVDGVAGVLLAAFFLLSLGLAVRQLRRIVRTGHPLDPSGPLRAGRVLLAGTVATEPGTIGAVIDLAIEQTSRQVRSKHGLHIVWTESSRRITARPFRLVLSPTVQVRIEPGERVDLVDRLEPPSEGAYPGKRVRHARLTPGERAYIEGDLTPGSDPGRPGEVYRGGSTPGRPHILRPGADGVLRVTASEPPADRWARRATLHLAAAAVWLAMLLICQFGAFRSFRALRSRGIVVEAPVTDTSTWTTRSKGGTRHHYSVSSELPDGTYASAEVDRYVYVLAREAAERGQALSVPWTVDPRDSTTYQIGRGEVGISQTAVTWLLLPILLVSLGQLVLVMNSRRWYERHKVEDIEPASS